MKKQKESSIAQAGGSPVAGPTAAAEPVYQQIKLALDVHPGDLMVVRMVDGAKPQPPQKMTTERFLDWAAKQKAQAREVISVYKAGPTGFWLHRQLTALGIRSYVVCPTCLDERRAGVNKLIRICFRRSAVREIWFRGAVSFAGIMPGFGRGFKHNFCRFLTMEALEWRSPERWCDSAHEKLAGCAHPKLATWR